MLRRLPQGVPGSLRCRANCGEVQEIQHEVRRLLLQSSLSSELPGNNNPTQPHWLTSLLLPRMPRLLVGAMLGVSSSQETSSVVFPSVTWSVQRPHSGENVQPSVKDSLATLTAVLPPVLLSVATGRYSVSSLLYLSSLKILLCQLSPDHLILQEKKGVRGWRCGGVRWNSWMLSRTL